MMGETSPGSFFGGGLSQPVSGAAPLEKESSMIALLVFSWRRREESELLIPFRELPQ